jgi:non-ribosomal peptide synthetase component F
MLSESASREQVVPATPVPELAFTVVEASAVAEAAVPTLCFRLRIAGKVEDDIRAVLLNAQVRIALARRAHDPATRDRLMELFGNRSQWSMAVQSLLWTHANITVAPFTGATAVDLPVACTQDMEVATAKYFHALADGDVPLDFLFSGSVFYADEQGSLRTCRIAWDREARFSLPLSVWRETMDRYYPGSVWLRLDRESFDRLQAWKARQALPSFQAAVNALLGAASPDAQ